MKDKQVFQEQIGRIEQLVQQVESTADPALGATAKELMQSVMDLHAAGLDRILEVIGKAGDPGASIIKLLSTDELVGSLLVLYGLHPDDFATRVERGFEKARQMLMRRAATLRLLGIDRGSVRLHIETNGHNCGSTRAELEGIVRGALFATAPDVTEVLMEPPQNEAATGFVPLESLHANVLVRP